ncbi:MAG: protein BatD [Muribaculaceae bacterium]|nr:protein BatD [Muribaculaceae bacterium]
MKRIINIAILILTTVMAAQAATFTVEAPSRVVEGNKFNVTFVLANGEGSNFTPPEVNGAKLLYGPSVSHSYSSSWVNGKTSKSSSEEYTMTYKATQSGKCHIGPASIVAGGKHMSTKAVTIEVLPAGSSQPSQQPQRTPGAATPYSDPMTQSAGKEVTGNDLFVRIELNKQHVYEQQAVVCNIKLYTKYQISEFIPTIQPSFDGFLIEEIPVQAALNKVETLNGHQYYVATLKRCILYPQQSGKLKITSGTYDVGVVQFDTYQSIFGTISNPVEKKLKLENHSETVTILPLPEPKPTSFTGAVGKFNVTTELKPATGFKTYSAATCRYIISGTGNIKYIKAPEVNFPEQFDVYDPKTDAQVNDGAGDMSGKVVVDYTFIPQYAGEFDIPATEFSYFDPETGKYVTLNVPSHHLSVAKGEGQPSNHYRMKNMDIRPIKSGDLGLKKSHSYIVDHWTYWLWFLLPLLAMVALLLYYRKQLKERADVRRMRSKRASKVAQRRLKAARSFASRSDRNGFYAEMLNALWGYMSDKLSIPVSELSKDNINAELEQYGIDEQLRQESIALIDKCEFAQYAPELASDDMNAVLDEAAGIIDRLESVKRKKTIAES